MSLLELRILVILTAISSGIIVGSMLTEWRIKESVAGSETTARVAEEKGMKDSPPAYIIKKEKSVTREAWVFDGGGVYGTPERKVVLPDIRANCVLIQREFERRTIAGPFYGWPFHEEVIPFRPRNESEGKIVYSPEPGRDSIKGAVREAGEAIIGEPDANSKEKQRSSDVY